MNPTDPITPPAEPASVPSPPLAYLDPAFVNGDDGRAVRTLAEYLQPLERFREAGVQDTVVFFGSARLGPEGPLGGYYQAARELAGSVTRWSKGLPPGSHRYVVCSGGGPGIMEAGNRGASEAGGLSIGLNISLPFEQHPNPFSTHRLSLEFHYFFNAQAVVSHTWRRPWWPFPAASARWTSCSRFSPWRRPASWIAASRSSSSAGPSGRRCSTLRRWCAMAPFRRRNLALFKYAEEPAEALRLIQEGIEPDATGATPSIARSRNRRRLR